MASSRMHSRWKRNKINAIARKRGFLEITCHFTRVSKISIVLFSTSFIYAKPHNCSYNVNFSTEALICWDKFGARLSGNCGLFFFFPLFRYFFHFIFYKRYLVCFLQIEKKTLEPFLLKLTQTTKKE